MTITNREVVDEFKQAQAQGGGQQLGGGPEAADQDAAAGSSGTGGYGNAQNQAFHQGQGADHEKPANREMSRGERFDMEQGGGRSGDSLGDDNLDANERAQNEAGQRFIDEQEQGGAA